MRFTDSQSNLVSQALVLAADKYVGFAVSVIGTAGGERLQQQFLRQATEVRQIAILIGDGGELTLEIPTHEIREAAAEAARITNQQYADTIAESAGSMTALKPGTRVCRETAVYTRGRALVCCLHPGWIELRPKGLRTGYSIDLLAIYHLGAKKEAERTRAEKLAARKQRRAK